MHQVPSIMPPTAGAHQSIPAGPFRTAIQDMPPIQAGTRSHQPKRAPSPTILTGEAGCSLVMSRLLTWGIAAQPAMGGLAYDILADIPGLDVVRVQVKTRSRPRGQRCSFNLTRGYFYSPKGMFKYHKDDYDIAAFVCLSLGQVFFCAAPIDRVSVRAAWLRSADVDIETFGIAVASVKHRRNAEAISWLASMDPAEPPVSPGAPAVVDEAPLQPCLF